VGVGDDPRVGVVGSCNVDYVVRVAHLARPGETVRGADVARLPGGKGANQAVAAARLGAAVTMIGCVGADADGELIESTLADNGVDVSGLRHSSRPTGAAFISVDDAGENQIVLSPGANVELDASTSDLESFDVVLAQLEAPAAAVAEAARRARRLVLNVAPVAPVGADVLERCAVIVANEVEVESLDLTRLGHVVVTLGAQGAVHLRFGREVARVAAPLVAVLDTVGAGDAFCAAYAVQFAKGADAYDALTYAVVAGALATRASGAQGSLATDQEVRAWLARG
jgi:ribokinase